MRTGEDLLVASGYAGRLREFSELLRILDRELRLITPSDPEGMDSGAVGPCQQVPHYQLTHDYLVPALRTWLTREQKQTRRGRAE